MVHFDNIYPIDYLFLKVEGMPPMNVPLCEVITGVLIRAKLTPESISIYSEELRSKGDDPYIVVSREGFKDHLESAFELGRIEAYALQPEGELTTEEVCEFKNKFEEGHSKT